MARQRNHDIRIKTAALQLKYKYKPKKFRRLGVYGFMGLELVAIPLILFEYELPSSVKNQIQTQIQIQT